MALAKEMMQGGTSAMQARALNGGTSATVTAAGTIITDATDLTASMTVITTAAASTGVQLYNGEIGDSQEILNLGANAVKVYPDSASNSINQLGAGSAFSLAPNTSCVVRKMTTTRWTAYLSA